MNVGPLPRRLKITIIDDSPELLGMLRVIFESLECHVFEAGGSAAGLELVLKEIPDLVVTDYCMPTMNGYEMIRKIRENPASHSIPVILLSGSQKSDSLLEVFEQDGIHFLRKPLSREQVIGTVERILGGYFQKHGALEGKPLEVERFEDARAAAEPAAPPEIDAAMKPVPLHIDDAELKISKDHAPARPASERSVDLTASSELDERSVSYKVNRIILTAVSQGASDIHIEPQETSLVVRIRIDGHLVPVMTELLSVAPAIISRIKIMASIDISERRMPQDGRFSMRLGPGQKVDVRVSTLPCKHGEKVVMRLLGQAQAGRSLFDSDLPERDKSCLRTALASPHGLILVTGPTGSGKTSTLYSMLSSLNTVNRNIVTVEDPIEFALPGVNQVQVNNETGLTFARILRAFLRQDPDVMLVGEIRDAETAEISLKAAVTGHLVLSTLHTNDAPGAVMRLAHMGVPTYLIGGAVKLIVAQRLVRRLCVHCKTEAPLSAEEAVLLGADAASMPTVFKSVGCVRCHNVGYSGRAPILEVMPVATPEMKSMLSRASDYESVRQAALAEGMTPLRGAALSLVRAGVTSLSESFLAVAAD